MVSKTASPMLESLVMHKSTSDTGGTSSATPITPHDIGAEDMAIHVTCSHMLPTYSACVDHCSCSCHRTERTCTSRILRRALGALFVAYTALPMLTSLCDSTRCSRAASGFLTITYLFPQWFWSRRIFRGVNFLRDSSPEFVLRLSHIRPHNA